MADSSTLFDKSVANLRTAQILFEHAVDDEEQVNAIGYHLQQAMELAIKYLLEQDGVEYPKTHDIDQLVRIANENDVDLQLSEYLEDHSEMLSQWEAKTRYVIGYGIERKKAERALREIDAYLQETAKRERSEIEQSEEA